MSGNVEAKIDPTHQQSAPAPTEQKTTLSASSTGGRSISISISGSQSKTLTTQSTKSQASNDITAEAQDENYTPQAFEQAWKLFAQRIPEIVSAVSYIRSNIPVLIDGHRYELIFSNIMQDNEFKKLMTELSTFMRQQLRNSAISFSSKVIESTEVPRSNNPEEILKKMTDENPVLELLKNNLKLEID